MITPDLYTRLSMFVVFASAMDNSVSFTRGLKPLVRITAKQAFVEASTPPVSPVNIPFTKKPDTAAKPSAKNKQMKKNRVLLR